MNAIYCVTAGCRNNAERVVIARTNGTQAEAYCAKCRQWTDWRAEACKPVAISAGLVTMKA